MTRTAALTNARRQPCPLVCTQDIAPVWPIAHASNRRGANRRPRSRPFCLSPERGRGWAQLGARRAALERSITMGDSGAVNAAKGVVEDAKGKAKEFAGRVVGNERLEREGEAQQDKAANE